VRAGKIPNVVRSLSLGVEDTKDRRRWGIRNGESGGDDGRVEAVARGRGGADAGVGDVGEAGSVLVGGGLGEDVVDLAVGSEDVVELFLGNLWR
jgi:hypothetical protein